MSDLNEALIKLNEDYLKLLNSKEYNLGRRIYKYVDLIRRHDFRALKNRYKEEKALKRVRRINHLNTTDYYNPGQSSYAGSSLVVYTCITGGYDIPKDPVYIGNNTRYIMFSDSPIFFSKKVKKWEVEEIPKAASQLGDSYKNRYCKMHPFELFDNKYEYSIYIDGNVETIGDISYLCSIARDSDIGIAMHSHRNRVCAYDEGEACITLGRGNKDKIESQLRYYREKGFPEEFGLKEATIIVVDLKNEKAKKIMNCWWEELLRSESGRDQLSFPFVVWRLGYTMNQIGDLGSNKNRNPLFRVEVHNK